MHVGRRERKVPVEPPPKNRRQDRSGAPGGQPPIDPGGNHSSGNGDSDRDGDGGKDGDRRGNEYGPKESIVYQSTNSPIINQVTWRWDCVSEKDLHT